MTGVEISRMAIGVTRAVIATVGVGLLMMSPVQTLVSLLLQGTFHLL